MLRCCVYTGLAAELGFNTLDTQIVQNIRDAIKLMDTNSVDHLSAKKTIVAAAINASIKDDKLMTAFSERMGVTWRFAKSALEHRCKIFDPNDEDHPWVITKR